MFSASPGPEPNCTANSADHRIVVYTAIAGGVDQLREPVHVSPRVDHVCFTDNPHLASTHWELRPFDERFENPTRTAKKPKILPHRYFPEYEVSVWIDGNQTVEADLAELAESSLENRSLALFRHPDGREDLYDEARACIRLGKDDPDTINRQVERYREAGFPGRAPDPDVHGARPPASRPAGLVEAMEDWWREIGAGSRRDQVSFDYVAWRHELAYELDRGRRAGQPLPHLAPPRCRREGEGAARPARAGRDRRPLPPRLRRVRGRPFSRCLRRKEKRVRSRRRKRAPTWS